MRPLLNLGLGLCLCLVLATSLSADELHLKDGTVIKGLIVSYDQNTFRVKTNFGYAVIRRDAVVSIVMTGVNSAPALKPGGVVGPIPVTAAPGSPAEAAAKKEAEEASKNAPAPATPAPTTNTPPASTPPANPPAVTATATTATPPPSTSSSPVTPASTTAVSTPPPPSSSPAPAATSTTAANNPNPSNNQPSPKSASAPAPSVSAPPPSTTAAAKPTNPPPETPKPAAVTTAVNQPPTTSAPSSRSSAPASSATMSTSNNSPRQPSNANSASAQTSKPAPSSATSAPITSASVSSGSPTHTASNLPPPLIGEGTTSNQSSNQTSASNQGRPIITTSASNQATPISVTPAYNGGSNQPYKPTESQTLASQLAPINPAETHSAVTDYNGSDYTAHSRNPAAQPIREYIVANTYFNQTFDFKMYRPPEWGLIDSAHAVLPGAIAALGTDDEKTYLLIGASPATGSLDADLHTADTKLKEILDHYRSLNDTTVTISGFPALEHHFRGGIDQREWAGALVVFERGSELYTVLGMTEGDTDLSLLKENVIQRVITSVDFSH
jgi:hypothetical protein